MPYSISVSRFSFVQFSEIDTIASCNFVDTDMCLPAYDENDAWFQFVITGDTEEEVDALCSDIDLISLGLVENCFDGFMLEFTEKPSRYRISANKLLYVWQHGLPGFREVLQVGECFHIKIEIADQSFCSNCFQRIGDDCHTSVIQYGNDENSFDFNYCSGANAEQDDDLDCAATEIVFTNQSTMTIPWTAFLQAKYGSTPDVQVWIVDENGELVAAGLRVALDSYPPTEIRIDFGGNASGVVKIM
jgi:hypothetical protein